MNEDKRVFEIVLNSLEIVEECSWDSFLFFLALSVLVFQKKREGKIWKKWKTEKNVEKKRMEGCDAVIILDNFHGNQTKFA